MTKDGFICGWHGLTGVRDTFPSRHMTFENRAEWLAGYAWGEEMRSRYGAELAK